MPLNVVFYLLLSSLFHLLNQLNVLGNSYAFGDGVVRFKKHLLYTIGLKSNNYIVLGLETN